MGIDDQRLDFSWECGSWRREDAPWRKDLPGWYQRATIWIRDKAVRDTSGGVREEGRYGVETSGSIREFSCLEKEKWDEGKRETMTNTDNGINTAREVLGSWASFS